MNVSKKYATSLTLVALSALLAGCTQDVGGFISASSEEKATVPVTSAPMPSVVQHLPRVEATLACINRTGALKGRTFVVGPFADSTGKINATAVGATGNFIPQGGSAAFVTDALSKAGARVVSTYFGQPAVNSPAQYAINGIFNSLDFGTPMAADIRVAGVGPTAQIGWASLSLSVQLDEAGTRINRQMSMIQRPVRYSQLGAGVGSIINQTLVTGAVTFQNQERLQFEAINGPIALGVADVLMKEFPAARAACYPIVADLLATTQAGLDVEAQPVVPAATPSRPEPKSQPSSMASVPVTNTTVVRTAVPQPSVAAPKPTAAVSQPRNTAAKPSTRERVDAVPVKSKPAKPVASKTLEQNDEPKVARRSSDKMSAVEQPARPVLGDVAILQSGFSGGGNARSGSSSSFSPDARFGTLDAAGIRFASSKGQDDNL